MAISEKRRGSITFLLVGIILLVTVGGLFIAFAPVRTCPGCEIQIAIAKGITTLRNGPPAPVVHQCSHCNGHAKVTPLKYWRDCMSGHRWVPPD